MLARGHGWVHTYCRSVSQWQQLLYECGFDNVVVPMSEGTPFANFLLVARAR
jgi:cobalamin biosynthesis Co2+ chelatase CbiK